MDARFLTILASTCSDQQVSGLADVFRARRALGVMLFNIGVVARQFDSGGRIAKNSFGEVAFLECKGVNLILCLRDAHAEQHLLLEDCPIVVEVLLSTVARLTTPRSSNSFNHHVGRRRDLQGHAERPSSNHDL